MTDLSQLSDEQLTALYNGDAPATPSGRLYVGPNAPDLSKMSDADLLAAYDNHPDVLADIAKSGGIGLVKGGLSVAGLPGDVGSLFGKAVDKIGDAVGASPDGVQQFKDAARKAVNVTPLGILNGPSSQDLRNDLESVTGPLYEPKTTAGDYAQTIGEFAPSVIGGPEALGTKVASRVLAPAIASETAGQLTKGTVAEPYARAAAALAGAGGAAAALAPRAAAAPTAEALGDAASAAYNHPTVKALELHPSSTTAATGKIINDLNSSGFRQLTAPQTYGLVKELEVPLAQAALGKTANVADIQSVRTALGKVAGNFSNPVEQAAATKAIKGIDDYLANLHVFDVASGDGSGAASILKEARDNYAAMKRVQRVDDAEYRGELNAASAHSGGNVNNATRQALKSILLSPAKRRGFSADEIAQMEKVVKGSPIGNVARFMSKILATSGMHGAGVAAGSVAAAPLTHGMTLALPAIGYAAKKVADTSTARAIAELDRMTALRSPLGRTIAKPRLYTPPLAIGAGAGLSQLRPIFLPASRN